MLTSSFVNPAAIGGQESTPQSLPSQLHSGRVWPGMHPQQAALAKAQVEAQQQQHNPIPEEIISRLLNQTRHSSVASSNDNHAKKKLSRKERRQLLADESIELIVCD